MAPFIPGREWLAGTQLSASAVILSGAIRNISRDFGEGARGEPFRKSAGIVLPGLFLIQLARTGGRFRCRMMRLSPLQSRRRHATMRG
ncbi:MULTISPECIES: hypothetical protein [Rhodanobacter]|uniref:hypothetical protein n=1 Tax=Rhodanobacter TaxID=75309 RepID=UPI00041ADD42|nr:MULTISPECIES: hypothetical protein [Rhodanobacter]UJJ50851.1 hypothetical protein LRK52_16685 [Rhodanobacter denitrificans]UJJ56949.1 hypothetical protein LRK55_09680 [Rhodanobacter denitrificans]UJM86148.1 hypothetical protein LRJ86_15365 [Rhodanobacter denitrificans]UJM90819.1 hypothetical protein LRK24_02630 [Rhodanobacter denitrificans]UJM93566.1 hypothetical protein LRK32_16590 [Rhodanobacter denitrificans]